MCGIAGAIGRIDQGTLDAVRAMTVAQTHRGPDDEGYWSTDHKEPAQRGAAFGFRRLSIIDLSIDGHQPMIDPDTGNVIIFNGEIYNFQELRTELGSAGERFRSRSDTEVILKAYARWGADAITRLRGMFALALWDARQRHVLLARDRIGIKPLYVCSLTRSGDAGEQQTVLFASELRSLLASNLIARRLNPAAVSSYLWNGFVTGPDTIVEGVRLLPAGTMAVIEPAGSRCELHRYWKLPKESSDSGNGIERLRHELRTAVRQHLISDVPLGVFLSGGVDSSAISALAAQCADGAVDERIRTFNISFDEAEYDESRYAKAVAQTLGTQHTDVRLTARDFQSHLHDALRSIDQPTFDAINTYFVSRAVREAGMTVALAGTGGDELFGGYRSFVDVPRAAAVARWARWLPEPLLRKAGMGIARLKFGRFGDIPPQTRWGKLGDMLATRGSLVQAYQVSYALFTQDVHEKLLARTGDSESRFMEQGHGSELSKVIAGSSVLHAVSVLELSSYIGERLLRDTDAASMAVSLEVRVPLLDHEVIEAAAGLNVDSRFKPLGRKAVLRDLCLGGVDPKLFDRPKSGFVLPIEKWCRLQLRDEVAEMLADAGLCARAGLDHQMVGRLWRSFEQQAPGMYWSRIWAIFVMLWWCKEHRLSV